MVNTEDFTKRLQQVLEYYGVSASAFADRIGVQRSSISHILSGRNKPSLEFVLRILQAYPEVELYWLLNGKGTFPAGKEKPETGKTVLPATSPDLFSGTSPAQDTGKETDAPGKHPELERIVFFYKDGTFKEYRKE
ncbi:helix-turn-helix domain-containing protein [Sinomicrobium soli]|uniref:helix-turn-helix domain-containing protein n=1 Tax=Sinomicrobium sp. N-1-3-6 TaxID=2219864 RepID=UPI000DCCAB9A|nr:helix-turn-helix transcriptional regulator [Sinomicrobium sp. N-1-3-6]RAV28750.1 transcriptional regulator [Sinomicrobium sp. N-1-3-6]